MSKDEYPNKLPKYLWFFDSPFFTGIAIGLIFIVTSFSGPNYYSIIIFFLAIMGLNEIHSILQRKYNVQVFSPSWFRAIWWTILGLEFILSFVLPSTIWK